MGLILILNHLLKNKLAKEIVFVHPSAWLLSNKDGAAIFKESKDLAEKYLKNVKMFNGNNVFGIKQFTPCMISHFKTDGNNQQINIKYFEDKFQASSVDDITVFGSKWFYIKNIYNKMLNICKKDNIHNHRIKSGNFNYYAQIAGVRGSVSSPHSQTNKLISDDFYTMITKTSKENKELTKNIDSAGKITYGFNTELERNNFIDYLKTDFARICLSFLKVNGNNHRGELKLISWLDFTQHWDDEKLFKYFDVDVETQNYIKSFLPDFYNIRD